MPRNIPRTATEMQELLKHLRLTGDPMGLAGDFESQAILVNLALTRYLAEPDFPRKLKWLNALHSSLMLGCPTSMYPSHEDHVRSVWIQTSASEDVEIETLCESIVNLFVERGTEPHRVMDRLRKSPHFRVVPGMEAFEPAGDGTYFFRVTDGYINKTEESSLVHVLNGHRGYNEPRLLPFSRPYLFELSRTDAATTGCMLKLVRDAYDDSLIFARPDGIEWRVSLPDGRTICATLEFDALALALDSCPLSDSSCI